MFAIFGKTAKEVDYKTNLFFDTIKLILNDVLKLKKDYTTFKHLLDSASQNRYESIDKLNNNLETMLMNKDTIISHGYELLLLEGAIKAGEEKNEK
jgi:late competence protein required for DNA uptake (superfamily II DNA/RNA helicase)